MASVKDVKKLEVFARASLPTQFGEFQIVAFTDGENRIEDVAIIRGELHGRENVPTRVHSECVTGDVFHSLRCDCRQQLESAQRHFAELPEAIILYMRQEGRGIGLANKVAAYELQENGYDTVDANLHLGFDDDLRSYDTAAAMLNALGVVSINLYTNNPRKIKGLEEYGICIAHREPIVIQPNSYNDRYLRTKQEKSGHLLDFKEE